MGILEIVLLIIGGVIFTLSFVIPVQKEEVSEDTKTLAKNEIESLISQEMNNIRSHVDDVVEESMEYAMEKTERSLERLSNEKIMAVNEYSDTVLKEIHRNHEEVMFLYDMLNDKHTNLKNTVTEINKTVKEVTETKKEAEAVVQSFHKLTPNVATEKATAVTSHMVDTKPKEKITITGLARAASAGKDMAEQITEKSTAMDISFTSDSNTEGRNCNEKILELHKQGKSKVAIAKELGLGVGEVKLVIDLYQSV